MIHSVSSSRRLDHGGDYMVTPVVYLLAPSGRRVPVQVSGSSKSSYTVVYTPTESGILTDLRFHSRYDNDIK